MIDISEHARKSMLDDGITEEEIRECLESGELEIKQFVKGEMRYGKKLEMKDKDFMVIYTRRKETQRIITCYLVRRKKWQKR